MLKSLQIENYKCFKNSGKAELGRTMTVVIGQNNSGKSTFLSCCKFNGFSGIPFRGLSSEEGVPLNQNSKLKFSYEMNGKYLRKTLLNVPGHFYLAYDQLAQVPGQQIQATSEELFNEIVNSGSITIQGECNSAGSLLGFQITTNKNAQVFPGNSYFRFDPDPNSQSIKMIQGTTNANDESIRLWITKGIVNSFYAFQAERLNIGQSDVNAVTELAPNGQNLAQVLHKLREDNLRFQEYVRCVNVVLPNIAQVIPKITGSNQVSIKIAFHPETVDRPDLLFGLDECGTGVSQVLCILYVAINSRLPTTIIIDEPNSFLHPGASKKLIEVLKTYSKHQYIISTHSPELIQTADPEQLLLVNWTADGSEITSIDRKDVNAIRIALGELGVNLSDLFGLDQIIWVEGQTEANTFPLILAHKKVKLKSGTAFVPLRATGDILSNQKVAFFEIYRAVTSTNAVLPPAVAFSLDTENLTEGQMKDINNRSSGITKFLPRRTYENYLLHPGGIAALFAANNQSVEVDDISNLIASEKDKEPTKEKWLNTIDGAKLISSLFKTLSKNEFIYRKVEHGSWLTAWLLANDPEHISELCNYVMDLTVQLNEPEQSH